MDRVYFGLDIGTLKILSSRAADCAERKRMDEPMQILDAVLMEKYRQQSGTGRL